MKCIFTYALFIFLMFSSTPGFAKEILPTFSESMLLVPTDLVMSLPPGGDGAGNGGGPDKALIIAAEASIADTIVLCQKADFCIDDENGFLNRVVRNKPLEREIVFKTSKKEPRFVVDKSKELLFFTETYVGSENILNTRLLEAATDLDAHKYVLSFYAQHYPDLDESQKTKELTAFYSFLKNKVVIASLNSWNQPHIRFLYRKDDPTLIVTDLITSYRIPFDDNCSSINTFKIQQFQVQQLYPGYIKAQATLTYNCSGNNHRIRIEPTVFFESALDWEQFFVNSNKFQLQIKKVTWQKFLL
jgi:hypothetical protein